MIVFIRSDDRLIHGQCQTKIIPLNKINRVIGVDDETVQNPMLKKVFEMAAPSGVRCTVHSVKEALEPIRKCCVNDKRTLIIARRPSTLLKLFQAIPELPKSINCANIPQSKEGFLIRRDIWIDPEQQAALSELDALGVDVYFQQFPGNNGPEIHWKDEKGKH